MSISKSDRSPFLTYTLLPSQDFASGGLRLGFLITQNEQLRDACKLVLYLFWTRQCQKAPVSFTIILTLSNSRLYRRLHSASQTSITIGMRMLEDRDFVSRFTAKSRESLAVSYRIITSTLDRDGINYIKGG